MNIRGRPFQAPVYQSLYVGSVPANAQASSGGPAKMRLLLERAQEAALHCSRSGSSRLLGDSEAAAAYRTALTFDDDLVQAYIGLSELRMPGTII